MIIATFALLRFVAYMASTLLFGASAMLALSGSRGLRLSVEADLRKVLRGASVAGMLSVLCLLPLQTASIAGEWQAMAQTDMLATVALQTRYGQAWILRAAAMLLVLCLFLRPRPDWTWPRALASGLALLPLALSGHAAMEEGRTGLLHALNDMLHCLAAGFWLGSLPVFLLILRRWTEPACRADATRLDALLDRRACRRRGPAA